MKNQHYIFILMLSLSSILFSCSSDSGANSPIIGSWENNQGHIFDFKPGGDMIWVYPSGSKTDTFDVQYRYNGSAEPKILDIYGFENGPLKGSTLYGIVKFIDYEGKDVIRCNFNRGEDESARPEEFLARRRTLYMRQEHIEDFPEPSRN